MQVRRINLDDTLPIRRQVLWPNRPPDEIVYPEDSDPDTFHLGAFDDEGALAGIVTLYHDGGSVWRLRGMGVWTEHQGRGAGTSLVETAVRELIGLGATEVWCNARLAALGFYERFGWEIEGEAFVIPGVGPHNVMRYLIT